MHLADNYGAIIIPYHVDEDYAKTTQFGAAESLTVLCPASFISACSAMICRDRRDFSVEA